MLNTRHSHLYRTLICLGLCVLAIVALRPVIAQAFWPMIPPPPPPPPTVTPTVPRSTQTPTLTPTPPAFAPAIAAPAQPAGGFIELRVHFPADWPWHQIHWQTLHTQVQWQDKAGIWHDVEGWRGELDKLVDAPEDLTAYKPNKLQQSGTTEKRTTWQGYKTWWMEKALLGRGPFRWLVYHETPGAVLAISEPFTLPTQTAERTVVEVTLE